MARFSDILVDQFGTPIPGALVAVNNTVTSFSAVLTADDGSALPNPLVSAADGSYYFNTPDGAYDLVFRLGGRVIAELLNTYVGLVSQLPEGSVANSLGSSTNVAPSQAAISGIFAGTVPVSFLDDETGNLKVGTLRLSGGVPIFVPSS